MNEPETMEVAGISREQARALFEELDDLGYPCDLEASTTSPMFDDETPKQRRYAVEVRAEGPSHIRRVLVLAEKYGAQVSISSSRLRLT